jgi:hypothetical protein
MQETRYSMMASCKNCGNLGNIDSNFCPNCGEPLNQKATQQKKDSGNNEIYGDFNPNFNNAGSSKTATTYNDENTTLFCILGFCFPLVGLILYLVLMNDKPASARSAGLGALIGFAISVLASLISFGLQSWFLYN